MIGAIIQGDLAADPVERTTKAGNPFWTATMRAAAGEQSLFVGLSTFNPQAGERLMQLRKGSPLAAVGVLEAKTWTGKGGSERESLRLTVNEILTVHQAARKRREAAGGEHADA